MESTKILNVDTENVLKTDSRRTRHNSVCISEVSSSNELNKTVELIIDSLEPDTVTNNITDQADVPNTAISSSSKITGNLFKVSFLKVSVPFLMIPLNQTVIYHRFPNSFSSSIQMPTEPSKKKFYTGGSSILATPSS